MLTDPHPCPACVHSQCGTGRKQPTRTSRVVPWCARCWVSSAGAEAPWVGLRPAASGAEQCGSGAARACKDVASSQRLRGGGEGTCWGLANTAWVTPGWTAARGGGPGRLGRSQIQGECMNTSIRCKMWEVIVPLCSSRVGLHLKQGKVGSASLERFEERLDSH